MDEKMRYEELRKKFLTWENILCKEMDEGIRCAKCNAKLFTKENIYCSICVKQMPYEQYLIDVYNAYEQTLNELVVMGVMGKTKGEKYYLTFEFGEYFDLMKKYSQDEYNLFWKKMKEHKRKIYP